MRIQNPKSKIKNWIGGGGGNWTRIQELRPVKSTRLVRLLKISFAKSQQTDKTFSQTSLTKSRARSQTENARQLEISCALDRSLQADFRQDIAVAKVN